MSVFAVYGIGSDQDVLQTYYAYIRHVVSDTYLDTDDNTFKAFGALVAGKHPMIEDSNQPGCWFLTLGFPVITGEAVFLPRDGLTDFLQADYVRSVYLSDGVDLLGAATSRVMLHTDYGGLNTLRLVDDEGAPVAGATVAVYTKAEYDAGDLTAPRGVTVTNEDGRWVDAIGVGASTTYTIHFQSTTGSVGPMSVEIVVP